MMTNLGDNKPANSSFDDNVETIKFFRVAVHDDRRPRRNAGNWKDGPVRLREVYISKIFNNIMNEEEDNVLLDQLHEIQVHAVKRKKEWIEAITSSYNKSIMKASFALVKLYRTCQKQRSY